MTNAEGQSYTMTPYEERATLIVEWLRGDTPPESDLDFVTAQIREAVEEAQGPREKPPCGHDADCDCLKARWKAEAYESAAKIADSRIKARDDGGKPCCASTAQFIGRDIRARAKETK